jgi:tetratricopeptide (TPR) repeat protein
LGDPWGVARVSQFLGLLYLKLGNYEKAYFYFDQHLRNDERLRFMDGVSVALSNFGELYRRQGNYVQAEQYYEKSLTICREHGMKLDIGVNLYNLGMLALHQNDFAKASRHFNDYYEAARNTNEKIAARNLFIGLAAVAGGTNQLERAAKLWGAAQAVFDPTDNLFSAFDRAELDQHIQIARNQLGRERFELLQGVGQAMILEDAVEYALEKQCI